jgi:dipeptidyl aminopeptidase/acylaminoacyl peptidase
MKTLTLRAVATALLLVSTPLGANVHAQVPAAATASTFETRTVGPLVMQNIPVTPPAISARLNQYVNTRSAGFSSFTPDGGILITTRFGNTSQIHHVAMPGGARSQITYYDEAVGGGAMRPGTNSFIFSKDTGGDELFQLFMYNRDTGTTTQISEPGTRNGSATFSDDGRMLAWTVTRSGSPTRQTWVANPDDPSSRRLIHTGDGGWGIADISADKTKILMARYVSVTESTLHVVDVATGTVTQITPDLKVSYGGGSFDRTGRSIFTVSDERGEFSSLVRIDLATGARTWLTGSTNWDVEGFSISPDRRKLAYALNEDGLSQIFTMNADGPARPVRARLPVGIVGGLQWSPDSRRLGLTINTSRSPSDAYVYDISRSRLTRWTQSEIGGLNPARFVEPSLVRYPTFDQVNGAARTIPAFVYRATQPGPRPVIIQIHGGPEAQSRPGFSSTIQYWANELGITVITPNVRGSTGYGRSFVELDNGFKREDSVKDIGALLDWIKTQPDMDASKVIVYGGSYGGYMVLASMTNYPDRLAGGIDIVGISNFVTFLENTDGYRRDLRRVEYGDERDPAMRAFQTSISPLTNAHKISAPLFVVQGANDPRVPRSEAEQIVERVRANGREVWYMLAMDEGHGFAKKSNRDAQREAETLFLQQVLGVQ